MIQETFDSSKTPLNDLLKSIKEGKIQLPDFQRGWVWDDDRIKGLLASIAVSYPIGAVMLLETGNPDVRFKPRPIQGAPEISSYPESFILDGQQRLTTLYQTLYSNNIVETRDQKQKTIFRWYYFDIKKSLDSDSDIFDSIISIGKEKQITQNFGREVIFDISTREKEFENFCFPVNKALNSTDWFNSFMAFWGYNQEKIKLFQNFQNQILKRFETYQVPVIKMLKHNPKDAVCQVFEKVNTGGVSLSVFELLTATFAADEFNLREDWEARKKKWKDHDVIKNVGSNELLQSISLLATIEKRQNLSIVGVTPENLPAVSCKRKDVLKISLDVYQKWADLVTESIIVSGKFLKKNKIFKDRDIPYSTQIVPLSVIIARLGHKFENDGVRQKVLRWFWCGVFGELYGSANETRFAKDVMEVIDWINGGDEPSTIRDANFSEDRFYTLKTRNSAAYKGIFVLQMQNGSMDFKSGEEVEWTNYYDESIDIHHVFPQKWCEDNGISPDMYNSILNKTPLTAKTNRMIGGRAPSAYLETIRKQAEMDDSRIELILSSHFISKEKLESDNLEDFIKDRLEKLTLAVEKAMGKAVQRSSNSDTDD